MKNKSTFEPSASELNDLKDPTGQDLMHVDGRDWPTSTKNAQKSIQLLSAASINDGKYVHFG
jgi:hypothetical protein